jgi:hypothetical protein
LKPAWTNSSVRPYLEKNPSQKRAGGVAQGEALEFKPQYHKKRCNDLLPLIGQVLLRAYSVTRLCRRHGDIAGTKTDRSS